MLLSFRKTKETFFRMQFVMTDGGRKQSRNPMRSLIILFLIDFLQVIRVMSSPSYGWNQTTYNLAKHVDMVYNVTKLLEFILPRYTFFGLAFLMVAFALGDAFYCARLFSTGEITKLGPIKALRFMVAVVVTTLFSSVMKWLLIPLDCLVSEEKFFSSFFHGDDAPCKPWGFPEIFFTVPTITIIVFYVFFALTVAFFSLGTNPLTCAPHVQFTGRVEALFIFSKVLGTFLPFLSDFITPVAVSTILFAFCTAVLYQHLNLLPFHNISTNMVRGGIYTAMLWLSFSSVVVAAVDAVDAVEDGTMQTLQWLFVGFVPVAFPLGVFLVWRRRSTLNFAIDRLRGEYETQLLSLRSGSRGEGRGGKGKGSMSPPANNALSPRSQRDEDDFARKPSMPWLSSDSSVVDRTPIAKPRGAFEAFFNPSWERKRAFASAQDALTAIRALLMKRDESELPFLRYMICRALEEHPTSSELQVLNVSLLRFVFLQTAESSQADKKLRNAHGDLALDHEYVLYAVDRKAAQDQAAMSIGNGVFNAINLMEFDSGMQQARSAHMQCIVEIRKFWTMASRKKVKENSSLQPCIDRLVEFNESVASADTEYQALLEKYPQSAQLLGAYCSFCDTVLNDPTLANELRKKAAALREDDGEQMEDEMANEAHQAALERRSERSGASGNSEADDVRVKIQREFSAWSGAIFGKETLALLWVARRLKLCFLLLLVVSACGFAVIDFWLFKSQAQRDSHLINQTGLLRAWTITSLFFMRNQMMAAWRGEDAAVNEIGSKISGLAKNLQVQHWDNYELARTKRVTDFYSDKVDHGVELNVPSATGWSRSKLSFWNFGTDWARRMDRASSITLEELTDPSFEQGTVAEPKLNIKFLNENAFRVAIPALEDIVLVYEDEMSELWALTQTIVLSSLCASLSILAAILVLVVFRLVRSMGSLQHLYLACHVANALPHATTRKIAKFYKDAEQAMKAIMDEAEEKRLLENAEDEAVHEEAGSDRSWDKPTELRLGNGKSHGEDRFSMRNEEDWARKSNGAIGTVKEDSQALPVGVMSLNEENVSRWTKQAEAMPAAQHSPRRVRRVSVSEEAPEEIGATDHRTQLMQLMLPPSLPGVETAERLHRVGSSQTTLSSREPLARSAELVLRTADLVLATPRPREPELQDLQDNDAAWAPESVGELGALHIPGSGVVEREWDIPPPAGVAGYPSVGHGLEQAVTAPTRAHEVTVTVENDDTDSTRAADIEDDSGATGAQGRSRAAQMPNAGRNMYQDSDEDDTQEDSPPPPIVPRTRSPKLGERDSTLKSALRQPSFASKDPLEMGTIVEATGGEQRAPDEFLARKVLLKSKSLKNGSSRNFSGSTSGLMAGLGGILKKAESGSWKIPKLLHGDDVEWEHDQKQGRDAEQGSEMGDAENERLPLREVPEERARQMWECIKKHQRFSARTSVWLLSVAVIIGLSVLLNWYPARRMGDLVTLAPTINQAGRRRFLTRACAHFARELVIDDGFSRMNKVDIASALHYYVDELRRTNAAVMQGGDLGIEVGADHRNAYHNKVMYGDGCPWREDASDCSYAKRPGVAAKGLYQLSLSFMDAIESVLLRHGPPESEWNDAFQTPLRAEADGLFDFESIQYNATRVSKMLDEDPDLPFILDSFAGDLFQGFALIVELFDSELKAVVQNAMHDNEALFIVYMLTTFGGVYFILFQKAISESLREGDRARSFVARIPAHTLNELEIHTLSFIFQAQNDHDESHD